MLLMKNAIRIEDFPDNPAMAEQGAPFNILCTRSTYHSDMGLDTMAAAYALLRKGDDDLTLTIVGRIPEGLRSQVAPVFGDDSVEFCDFVEKPELMRRIARAGVCVVSFRDVPDLAQTYPIKVLEYMAMGKPVIVSRIGGMSELVEDGETGLLFRADDPADLAAKIRAIRTDPALAARLGTVARERSRAYDYAVKGRTILKTLQHLVA
jgi:glycosyltransferase involved in cell wall biosynthesis